MIGVFDSGFGGLTVLKSFLRKLPQYDFLYLGDNARAPYGEKSNEAIYGYVCGAIDFFVEKKCELVILACNTASAAALRKIQQEYLPSKYPSLKVLGVIRPIVEHVARDSAVKKAGVMGTKATIKSASYEKEFENMNREIVILSGAAPLLVPLIEEGMMKEVATKMILKKYLKPFKLAKVDALVLACTHYPILYNEIAKVMGRNVRIYKTGDIVADSLADYLDRHPELNIMNNNPARVSFYTTDDPGRMISFGKIVLGAEIGAVQKIII